MEHYHEAVEPLQKAIELNRRACVILQFRCSYNGAGLYREAEKSLKEFVQRRPEHADAFFELGFCHTDAIRQR